MEKYYLGLDQGTTGTTALIFDSQWNQIARGYKEHTQYYPEPGWVEHDPMEIWNSILETIAMAAEEAGADGTGGGRLFQRHEDTLDYGSCGGSQGEDRERPCDCRHA